jgi:hypothetical protein
MFNIGKGQKYLTIACRLLKMIGRVYIASARVVGFSPNRPDGDHREEFGSFLFLLPKSQSKRTTSPVRGRTFLANIKMRLT